MYSPKSPVFTQESPLCPICSTEHNLYSKETWGLEIANWRKSSVTSATCPKQSVTPRPRSSSPFIDNSYGLCLHVYIACVCVYMYVSAHRRLSTAHMDCNCMYILCVYVCVFACIYCVCVYMYASAHRRLSTAHMDCSRMYIWCVCVCVCVCMYQRIAVYR